MKLFKFLHAPRRKKAQPKMVERIASIAHTSEAIGWRPLPYVVPERFRIFQNVLDTNVTQYMTNAHPDLYNAHFFDEVIRSEVHLAIAEIDAQKTEHMMSIHHIRIYQRAVLKEMQQRLEQLEQVLTQNEEEVK